MGLGGVLGAGVKFAFETVAGPNYERRKAARRALVLYASPLLSAADSLDRRIQNFVSFADRGWFDDESDPYYRLSTLYVFGRYLAWCKLLEDESFLDLEPSRRKSKRFQIAYFRIYKGFTGFVYFHRIGRREISGIGEANIPRLALTAIAELMIKEGDTRQVLPFVDFAELYESDQRFRRWFRYLVDLLSNPQPVPGNARWNRIAIIGCNVRAFLHVAGKRKASARDFDRYLPLMYPEVANRVRGELADMHIISWQRKGQRRGRFWTSTRVRA